MSKKAAKKSRKAPEVWVAPDLMRRMKGADGNRGLPVPHSPYLALADKFLGYDGEKDSPASSLVQPPANAEPRPSADEPKRMAAAAGAGTVSRVFPKPPSGLVVPKPPRLTLPKPSPPKPPRINPPKPPKWA